MWWSKKQTTLDPEALADRAEDVLDGAGDSFQNAVDDTAGALYTEVAESSGDVDEPVSADAALQTEDAARSSFQVEIGDQEEFSDFEAEDDRGGHVLRNALFSTLVVGGAAVIGTLATDTSSLWYKKLDKPDWQPSPAVFPIAWTSLYVLTAVASTRTLSRLRRRDLKEEEGEYRRALVVNMALNAAWPVVYFQKKELGAAALTAGALALSSASLIGKARPAGRLCQVALTPYFLWNSFAAGLSSELWLRNR